MLHLNIIKVKTPEEMGKAAANKFEAVICRKPGPIGAGSERENIVAELICDGQHIHPSAGRFGHESLRLYAESSRIWHSERTGRSLRDADPCEGAWLRERDRLHRGRKTRRLCGL